MVCDSLLVLFSRVSPFYNTYFNFILNILKFCVLLLQFEHFSENFSLRRIFCFALVIFYILFIPFSTFILASESRSFLYHLLHFIICYHNYKHFSSFFACETLSVLLKLYILQLIFLNIQKQIVCGGPFILNLFSPLPWFLAAAFVRFLLVLFMLVCC